MSRCTAPKYGHRTQSGRDACPECSRRGHRSYNSFYSNPFASSHLTGTSPSGRSSGTGRNSKPRWASANSTIFYTSTEVQTLTPIRHTIENLAMRHELRDAFLCHAWDDRLSVAKELHDLLVSNGVSVWFSEKDVGLGVPLMRAIDKGLANSRIGLVLVTPALLRRLPQEGIADKELSALLARDQLVPIVHNTTYDALREVSPLLASRSGLSTAEGSLADVAAKLAELVALEPNYGNA